MPTASIILQQNGDGNTTPGSRDDLAISLPVTVLNQDNTGVTSWLWSIVDRPATSATVLASPTSSTTTFTPDIVGTYLIKLVVNASAVSNQVGAAIKTVNFNYRIPAAKETIEFDSARGWATAVDDALQKIDDATSNTYNKQFTDTSSHTVVSMTPTANSNFIVYIYYRVVTATTVVTIILTFDDASASQSINIVPTVSTTVGSYTVVPTYIQAKTSNPIVVSAQSGTSNNLFVSATIARLL